MKKYFYESVLLSCAVIFSSILYADNPHLKDFHLLDIMRKETPSIVQIGAVGLANLNLNRQGNVIAVYPQEKVFGMVNTTCDPDGIDPHALYQIVVGLEGVGPQKSILNELGYRVGPSILPFFLKAPETPGVYNIQVQLEQARSPLEAMQRFGEENSLLMTVGKIIVLDEQ